jgi:cytochrome c2
MKLTRVLSGMAVVLLFLLSSPAFTQILPENPTRGEEIFRNKGCVKCHPSRGEGSRIGPDLAKVDLGNTQLDLAAKVWNHTPSMIKEMEKGTIARPTLTGQEFTEISAYLYFIRFADEQGKALKGEVVFVEKGCSTCHVRSGRGSGLAPSLDSFPRNISPVFFTKGIWNHSLEMMARMVEIGMKWPKFMDSEMIDLLEFVKRNARGPEEAAFFRPGNPRDGQKVFAAKGCAKCHSVHGEGPRGGVDLGQTARTYYTSLTQIASTLWNKGPTILVKMTQAQFGSTNFTSKEMADLLSYLYFLHFIDGPGNVPNGRTLFVQIGCSNCHSLDEKRGKLTYIDLARYKDAAPTEIVAGMWNHTIQIQRAIGEQGLPWPQIQKGEMADLLEYMRSPTENR